MREGSKDSFDVGLETNSPDDLKQQFVFKHDNIYCYAGQHYTDGRLYTLQYEGNGDSGNLVVCGISHQTDREKMNLVSIRVSARHGVIISSH